MEMILMIVDCFSKLSTDLLPAKSQIYMYNNCIEQIESKNPVCLFACSGCHTNQYIIAKYWLELTPKASPPHPQESYSTYIKKSSKIKIKNNLQYLQSVPCLSVIYFFSYGK